MSVNNNFPFLPSNSQLTDNFLKKIVLVVNNLVNGKLNNTGEFTLAASATSTIVKNNLVNPNSVVFPIPSSASAALDWSSGSMYITTGDKEFTVTHDSDAATTRTFKYVVFG